MSTPNEVQDTEQVAIIGMSGRFPGASNVAEFWRNLRCGVESIRPFSDEELAVAGIDEVVRKQPGFINAGAPVDGIDLFDAGFFGFSPREAESMDPQHRLFLECAWEALEDAGYDPERYKRLIGVYAGAAMSTYLFHLLRNPQFVSLLGPYQIVLGNEKDHLTTRVSYKLNLRGPSLSIQTTCSTSLVSVCMACQGLLAYQCDMALAGGVGIRVPQATGYLFQEGGISSPDGHCRAFDAGSQGIVSGNGLGIVVLKRLSEALADCDSIYAIIRGFALNNDGSVKVGYTAPSQDGQAEVIAMAHAMADISPDTITYVETHGTATPLGDPIEIAALTQAFRVGTKRRQFCAIGSVKTNIGHLDTAAGIAGLIKTALALRHKEIPPSLHFKVPNPNIDFEGSPFYVNTASTPWASPTAPRRAGVSSFGIGGTNAHVVLEEAPQPEILPNIRPAQLLLLSARSPTALDAATRSLATFLEEHPNVDLGDLAYTTQIGRRSFGRRRFLVASGAAEAAHMLQIGDPVQLVTAPGEPRDRPVAFLFPGQGAQHVDMALQQYKFEPVFAGGVDFCASFLEHELGFDLRSLLYPSPEHAQTAEERLTRTEFAQPALFVVEYALAKLWISWGVHPESLIGHSIGEYVAACLAGVFSLEGALSLVAARGRLMQSMPEGAMLAVPMDRENLVGLLGPGVSVAATNGPALCVASGPPVAIAELESTLRTRGLECHRLQVSHAFHSAMMEPLCQEFAALVRQLDLNSPRIPILSNMTGSWMTAAMACDPNYWATHLCHTVRFSAGVQELLHHPERILLEVGPQQTLTRLAQLHARDGEKRTIVPSLPPAHARQGPYATQLASLGWLWLSGVHIDWDTFHAHAPRRRIALPTYPFERQRYWVEPSVGAMAPTAQSSPTTGAADVSGWLLTPVWKSSPIPALSYDGQSIGRSRWLVFVDEIGVAQRLAERAARQGAMIITVRPGATFVHEGKHAYVLDPKCGDDYLALLADVRAQGAAPDTICHAWMVGDPDFAEAGAERMEWALARGFFSLVYLARALIEIDPAHHVRVGVLSDALQAVRRGERVAVEKATVLGACRVIPQEVPNIVMRSIDIRVEELLGATDELLDLLVGEFVAEAPDHVLAYRGGSRWVQAFDPLAPVSPTAQPQLRERGVYLITGGLGGIGLTLAECLAQEVHARLVLVGRTPFPEREAWSEWVATNGPADETSQTIVTLQRIEQAGGELLVAPADVANIGQMRDVLARARARFGNVNGIVHAAGVAGGGLVQLKNPAVAAPVLRPKLHGMVVLDELCRDTEMDFLVICSSLSSFAGGIGQSDYCAANAFLDAYARQRATDGAFTVAIDWPTWREVGMTVRTPARRGQEGVKERWLAAGISCREGAEIFLRLLAGATPHVLVIPPALRVFFTGGSPAAEVLAGTAPSIEMAAPQEVPPAAGNAHARPALDTEFVAPRNETERRISEIWEALFGIVPVGVHDNFFDLGGHSLLAVQMGSRLREAFDVEITVRRLFKVPTIAECAIAIGDLLLSEIRDLGPEEAEALLRQDEGGGLGS
jgi:acyl transferase domain-containing protein